MALQRTWELSYAGVGLSLKGAALDEVLSKSTSGIHKVLSDHLKTPYDINTPFAWWPGETLQRLPYPRWPEYPPVTPGTYFYPTTASRWSVGYFLVTEAEKNAIETILYPSQSSIPTPQPFVMRADDITHLDNTGGVHTELYSLPIRPIGQTHSKESGLYLLTLVDERYYFQNKDAGQIHEPQLADWNTFFNILALAAGITLVAATPIDPVYGTPNPDSDLYTNHEQVNVLLDAAAWNVGAVIVRKFDGTYLLQRYSEAAATINANRPPYPRYRLLGGNILDPKEVNQKQGVQPGVTVRRLNSILPQSVTITYPKYSCVTPQDEDCLPMAYIENDVDRRCGFFIKDSYGDTWQEVVTIASLPQPQYAGYVGFNGTKLIHDTAKALYCNTDGSGSPTNEAQLNALAVQMARDFYDSNLYGLDEWYAGIRKWNPEAIDDILWHMGSSPTTTRVSRLPWNYGVDQMEHRLPECFDAVGSGSSSSSSMSSNQSFGSSSSSGTAVACDCPNMPDTLHATVTLVSGVIDDHMLGTFTLVFDGTKYTVCVSWSCGTPGSGLTCSADFNLYNLLSSACNFSINGYQHDNCGFTSCGSLVQFGPDSVTCSPIEFTFNNVKAHGFPVGCPFTTNTVLKVVVGP